MFGFSFGFAVLLLTFAAMWVSFYGWSYYIKLFFAYRKYIQLIGIACVGAFVYLIYTYAPTQGKNMLLCANNVIQYLPINRQTAGVVTHLIDLSESHNGTSFMSSMNQTLNPNFEAAKGQPALLDRSSEIQPTRKVKRNVSETLKKYTASSQDWKCAHCQKQLDHTFEIDHITRLEHGGSNNQLQALCRNCHGIKTASENMRR